MRHNDVKESGLVWMLVIVAIVGAVIYFMYSRHGKESGIKMPDQIYGELKKKYRQVETAEEPGSKPVAYVARGQLPSRVCTRC
jgi:hypothetical protein